MPRKFIFPPAAAKHPPPAQITEADLFILESLRFEDEQAKRFEGRIMAEILSLCGKKPIYYYFRTPDELNALAGVFRESGYRYLHLSCHGDVAGIHTTLGPVSSERFADIFAGLLKNRRLFVSACAIGRGRLPELVREKNKGMYSIACPMDPIRFNRAAAIWAAFYGRMFDKPEQQDNGAGAGNKKDRFLKNDQMQESFQHLCALFDVRFKWSYHNSKYDRWDDVLIPPTTIISGTPPSARS
jgi:hypothetical protein